MGNCFDYCIDVKRKNMECPKCKKQKKLKELTKKEFLKDGCFTCRIRKKYSYKPKNTTRSYYTLIST